MPKGPMLVLRRVAAYAIDIGVLFAVLGGAQVVLSRVTGFPSWSGFGENAFLLEGWVLLSMSLPCWLYFVLSDRFAYGATVGKRAMQLRVQSVDGAALDTAHALLRTAVKLAPWEVTHLGLMLPEPIMHVDAPAAWQWGALLVADVALLAYLGVLVATSGRRSLDDLAAGSRVVAGSMRRA